MRDDARKIAEGLSKAQRRALIGARLSTQAYPGEYLIPLATRMDVRARLLEKKLLGKRVVNPLTKLGLQVRTILTENDHG